MKIKLREVYEKAYEKACSLLSGEPARDDTSNEVSHGTETGGQTQVSEHVQSPASHDASVAKVSAIFACLGFIQEKLDQLATNNEQLLSEIYNCRSELDKEKQLRASAEQARDGLKANVERLEGQLLEQGVLRQDICKLEERLKDIIQDRDQKSLSLKNFEAENARLNLDLKKEKEDALLQKKELEAKASKIASLETSLGELKSSFSQRLEKLAPSALLSSEVRTELDDLDTRACAGDQDSIRVMSGVLQLRAALLPDVDPSERMHALKVLGSSLYSAWSKQGKDSRSIHGRFVLWMGVLNSVPNASYQIIVPDLLQPVPPNVEAPSGISKVSKVEQWIVKDGKGALFSKGKVS
jgi:DNA repair exonuclease SbcCD ATPase subunit